jgi:tight adherence protein B
MEIIFAITLSVSVSVFFYLIYNFFEQEQRLHTIDKIVSLRDDDTDIFDEYDENSFVTKLFSRAKTQLELAGISLHPMLFMMGTMVIISIGGTVSALFVHHVLGAIIGIIVISLAIYFNLNALIAKRRKKFNAALAQAIAVLVKMMQNGVGFDQALERSVDVSDTPFFRKLFRKFIQERNTYGEEDAFKNMQKTVESKELRIFALAIKIGRDSGGRFSTTLEKVETTISYRKKMQDKIDVVTRESQMGSYMIAGIGVLLYWMMDTNFEGKITDYFFGSDMARWQLMGIIAWVGIGLMANKAMSKVTK